MAYLKLAAALLFAAGLVAYPAQCADAAREAIASWADSVAPALFPFAAVMPFLTCDEARRAYDRLFGPVVRLLFRLPGGAASAIITGLVSGSPGGAMAVARVAAAEGLNRGQASRLAGIACGVSPVYALAVMGVALNGSKIMGWRLVIAQLAAQLVTGVIFRNSYNRDNRSVGSGFKDSHDKPVAAAVMAALRVCGYMTLFSVGIRLARILIGDCVDTVAIFIDLPTGAPDCTNEIKAAAALGFGGLCIAVQNMGVLGDMVKPSAYIAQKLVTVFLCAGAYMGLVRINFSHETLALANFHADFEVNLLVLTCIMLPILAVFLRKRVKKHIS